MTCLKGDVCNYPLCKCIFVTQPENDNTPEVYIWQTKKDYSEDNLIRAMGTVWKCTKAHTSDVFGNDAIVHKMWMEYQHD